MNDSNSNKTITGIESIGENTEKGSLGNITYPDQQSQEDRGDTDNSDSQDDSSQDDK